MEGHVDRGWQEWQQGGWGGAMTIVCEAWMTEIERKWTRERFLRQSQGGCAFYEAREEG